MRRSLIQLQNLLNEGYRVDDVDSTDDAIHVTLAQGTLCVLVTLDRDDAAAILDGALDAHLDEAGDDVPVSFLAHE